MAGPTPETIAATTVRVHQAGSQLRATTSRWFAENAGRLSVDASVRTVLEGCAGHSLRPPAELGPSTREPGPVVARLARSDSSR